MKRIKPKSDGPPIHQATLSDKTIRKSTRDTFVNFAAKVGLGTNNVSSGATYGFLPISRNRQMLEWMYRGSWICGVAVDCVAEDMCREGIEYTTELDPEDIEKLEEALDVRQIWQSLQLTTQWARLYGGCLGYIDIEGQDPATPLRTESVGPHQFRGVIPIDRWMVNPDVIGAIETPGPDFGLPDRYQIVASSMSFPMKPGQWIHHTRCLRIVGKELPYWQKIAENMWGISILEPVYDRLVAFDSTTLGAAQLVYKAYLRTYSIDGLRQLIAAGGDMYKAMLQQIELTRQYQSNEGLTLMDTKDKFEGHSYTFAGLSDVLLSMAEQISGATQIPIARLFGQSPGGLNSTGDHELRTYYDGIKRQQNRWFRRPLDVILRITAQSEGIELPEGFRYNFRSLWQMTEQQKSEIDSNDTTSVLNAKDAGLVSAQTALKELRQRGRQTGRWSNITDKEIADADDEIPDPMEMMQAGAAGDDEGGAQKPGDELSPKKGTVKVAAKDSATIIDVAGMPIHIENVKGSIRKGKDWQTVMPAHYGFLHGVGSAEGAFEELDCFVGDDLTSPDVFVIDQANIQGTPIFDEHKCMIGFKNKADAMDAYARAFSDGKGAERMMGITAMPVNQFKMWMRTANMNNPAAPKQEAAE